MNVGLYLAYSPPNKKMSLKQEGLGRYLAELIRAFANNGDKITIACPNWVVDSVEDLLDDFGIEKKAVQYLLPKGEPVFYRLYLHKVMKIKKSSKRRRIQRLALRFLDRMITFAVSLKNVTVFTVLMVLMGTISILLLPVWILLAIIMILWLILSKINKKVFHITTDIVSKPHLFLIRKIKKIRVAEQFMEYIKKHYNPMIIQERIRMSAAQEIIRHINHSAVETDIWYSPTAFWPEFNEIKGARVVCVPDVVTGEFPENFSKYDTASATEKVRKAICGGTFFITYCDYIKETLVEQYFGKENTNIITIKHAVNETLPYINIQGTFTKKLNVIDPIMQFARTVLPSMIDKNINMREYLGGNDFRFAFENVRYIFFPSQIRGNKNILTLVKAYEVVLREKHYPIKLFLTCKYNMDKELADYIYDHKLELDVLSFLQVTNQQLAALYKCAELVVNPTLYEGGVPFTFGEGLSVGTPSIMSNIPQVQEELAEYHLDEMLFDPYDYNDLAECIVYGLDHREELLKKQLPVYEKMKVRNWDVVGQEYVQAFALFAEKNRRRAGVC